MVEHLAEKKGALTVAKTVVLKAVEWVEKRVVKWVLATAASMVAS